MAGQKVETAAEWTLGACTEVEATADIDLCPWSVNESVPEMARLAKLT